MRVDFFFICSYFHTVLLANVSALSAIRYLRKYVKSESAASEKKSLLKALTDS